MINRDDSLLFAAEKRAREKRAQHALDKEVSRLSNLPASSTRHSTAEADTESPMPLPAKRRNATR